MKPDLNGKIVLITGSTDGLGKLVAVRLARRGATVLLHGRNEIKGKEVMAEIKVSSNTEKVEYYNADLSSLHEVKKLADTVIANHGTLDILINNAGIGGGPRGNKRRELSQDGYELRFAVNYLSHFVLTYRLLPIIKAAAPSRIINVSSIGQHPIDFENIMLEKNYDSYRAYRQSKLAQIMFTLDLADELKDTGIIVNSLHPATLMNTNMVHEFFGSTMSSVEEGADAVEYVATSDETANITGAYFDGKKKSKAIGQAYDVDARRTLREISFKLANNILDRP
jgi:NAD(P)-dependent dehydrogenase (short-subunit alcohol dehydrogenase family)